MSKNKPVTKERLEDSAFATLRFPLADSPPDTQPQMVNSVTLDDALAYGDERYEMGLMDAAKALCAACAGTDATVNARPALLSFSNGTTWIHGKKRRVGNRTCTAGPIHGLRRQTTCGKPTYGI